MILGQGAVMLTRNCFFVIFAYFRCTKLAKKTLREAQQGIAAEELEACNKVLLKVLENLK